MVNRAEEMVTMVDNRNLRAIVHDITGGVFLTKEGLKIFIRKFEERLKQHNSYLTYVEYPLSFRESLQFQVGSLVKAIENNDMSIYRTVLIR